MTATTSFAASRQPVNERQHTPEMVPATALITQQAPGSQHGTEFLSGRHTGSLADGRCARTSRLGHAVAYCSLDRFSLRHCSERHASEQYFRDDRDP
jgi:hypothetical protein